MTTLEEVARFCEPGARRNYHKIALTEKTARPRPACTSCATTRGRRSTSARPRTCGAARATTSCSARPTTRARRSSCSSASTSWRPARSSPRCCSRTRLIARHRPPYNSHGTAVAQLPLRQAQRRRVPAPVRHAQPARRRLLLRRAVPQGQPGPALRRLRQRRLPAAHLRAPAARRAREHACQRAGTGACLSPCSRPLNGEYAAVVDDVRRVLEGDADDLDRRLRRAPGGARPGARVRAGRAPAEPARDAGARACAACCACAPRSARTWCSSTRRAGAAGSRSGACAPARIVVEREVGRGAFDEEAAAAVLAELAAAEPPRPPLPAAAIDEMLLVHSWTRRAPRRAQRRRPARVLAGGGDARRAGRPPPAAPSAGRLRVGAGTGADAPAV